MRRYGTDHPSDPDRARIQEASDRCSRETMEEPPSTLGVQLFLAKLALEGGRLEEAADAIDAALWHYDNDKPSDIGLEAR